MNRLKNITAIEWFIMATIAFIVLSVFTRGILDYQHWQRCKAAGGFKRYVGSATHTAVQPIAQPDGTASVYVPVQYTSAVYECQDRNGRFIDVEAP